MRKPSTADRSQKDRLVALSVYGSREVALREYISKMRRRYARYELSADETRKVMDEALGARSLSQELYALREA